MINQVYFLNNIELDEEIKKIKEEDEKRMRIALGIEQPDD